MQASGLEELRQHFISEGMDELSFFIVNDKNLGSQLTISDLRERVDFPVYQERYENRIWEQLSGKKDDIIVYDRCGRLVDHLRLPYSYLKYDYVKNTIVHAYYELPCGPCENTQDEVVVDVLVSSEERTDDDAITYLIELEQEVQELDDRIRQQQEKEDGEWDDDEEDEDEWEEDTSESRSSEEQRDSSSSSSEEQRDGSRSSEEEDGSRSSREREDGSRSSREREDGSRSSEEEEDSSRSSEEGDNSRSPEELDARSSSSSEESRSSSSSSEESRNRSSTEIDNQSSSSVEESDSRSRSRSSEEGESNATTSEESGENKSKLKKYLKPFKWRKESGSNSMNKDVMSKSDERKDGDKTSGEGDDDKDWWKVERWPGMEDNAREEESSEERNDEDDDVPNRTKISEEIAPDEDGDESPEELEDERIIEEHSKHDHTFPTDR